MHRLTVALLAAFDAVVAAAAGLAVALAALTAMFIVGFGDGADWGALWPSAASVWQIGNLVPLPITLPAEYLVATGIPADAASFTLSLAPLAFTVFTAVFAARSGARAAGAQAWIPGVVAGSAVYAAIAAGVALTSVNPVAQPELWQAIAVPAVLYLLAAVSGAVVAGWTSGDGGPLDVLRERVDDAPSAWRVVPGLLARGAAIVVMSLIGLGAAAVSAAVLAGGGEIIALSEAAHVDVLGAVMTTLGALAYLPTLVVWGLAWIAGPGFALGTATSVNPGGTQVGVVPGVPVLGALPETLSGWLLLVVLLPVAAGAFAGWVQRSRFVRALESVPGAEQPLPRLVLAVGTAALAGGAAAVLAVLASGSIGPGRFTHVGPDPGPLALAVGIEVLVGAAILLLSPRRRSHAGEDDLAPAGSRDAGSGASSAGERDVDGGAGTGQTHSHDDAGQVVPVHVEPRAPRADAVGRRPGATSAVRGFAPARDDDPTPRSRDADDTETAPIDDDVTAPVPSEEDLDDDATRARRPRPLPPVD